MKFRLSLAAASPLALACVIGAGAFACSARPALDGGTGLLRIAADAPAANSCVRSAPASGTLQIRSLDERSSAHVSAAELSRDREARRTLPAGLYVVSWVPTPSGDDVSWLLREPKFLTVAAGRVTELHIHHETPPCDLWPAEVRDSRGAIARRL